MNDGITQDQIGKISAAIKRLDAAGAPWRLKTDIRVTSFIKANGCSKEKPVIVIELCMYTKSEHEYFLGEEIAKAKGVPYPFVPTMDIYAGRTMQFDWTVDAIERALLRYVPTDKDWATDWSTVTEPLFGIPPKS